MLFYIKSLLFNGIPLSFILFLTIILSSCKKNNDNEPQPVNPIFAVNFTDNFIAPQLQTIVFISDMQGKLLADTMVSGNGKVNILPESGVTIPSKFMVTIVTWSTFMHSLNIHLDTYYQIPVSEWTLQGHKADTIGHVTISLVNLPQLVGPVLYSNSGYNDLTSKTYGKTNDLYQSPDDLYIQIFTPSGPRYKWIPGITRGQAYEVDMSDASIPESKTVIFPMTAAYYEARTYGYRDANVESPLSYLVNEQFSDGNPVSSIEVSYPPAKFSTFHNAFSLVEDWTSPSTYFYWVDGEIPSAFKKIEATVTSIQSLPGKAEFSTSGNYNVSNMTWTFSSTDFQNFEWSIYAPDSVKTMILPSIPPSMQQMFPVLSLDSLSVSNVQLMNFYGLSSYDDFIYQTMVKNPPVSMSHLEASVVKSTPAR